MIDKKLVKTKISSIQNNLEQLKRFENLSFNEVVENYDTHKIVERIIELLINEAIDINQHFISESKLNKLSFDFKESFLLMEKLDVYPGSFAKKISLSVGLRNILVHQYNRLDEKIFYTSIKDCLKQYSQYCRYILKFLS